MRAQRTVTGTVAAVISYLEGTARTADTVLVAGVGYKVMTAAPLPVGEPVQLLVTTVARENSLTLYGFRSEEEQELFDALTKVQSIGPSIAMAALALGAAHVVAALVAKDTKALSKAKGLGAAGATKLVNMVKLSPTLLALADGQPTALFAGPVINDAARELAAMLQAEGYPREQAEAAAAAAVAAHDDDSSRLGAALAALISAAA